MEYSGKSSFTQEENRGHALLAPSWKKCCKYPRPQKACTQEIMLEMVLTWISNNLESAVEVHCEVLPG